MTLELTAAISAAYRKSDRTDRPAWIPMQLAEVVVESDDVKSFFLAPVDRRPLPRFEPGQHVVVSPEPVPRGDRPDAGDGMFTPRCYTLSATPDPRFWRITVKRPAADSPRGSTSQLLHRRATAGTRLKVSQPRGEFTLAAAAGAAPLALLSAGIGITPAYTLAAAALEDRSRDVWLFLQTTSWAQTPLRDDLVRLAASNQQLHLVVAFSRAGDELSTHTQLATPLANVHFLAGRLQPGEVAAAMPLPNESHCFVCGPQSWMEQLCGALPSCGVTADRIHTESFGGALRLPEDTHTADLERQDGSGVDPTLKAGGGCRVALADGGREILYRPGHGSWLDQLQRQGAEIQGGCRAGGCGTCMTRLLKGSVRMRADGAERPPEGWVLPCVAEPEGDVTLQL